jgi:hypothetical protein
MPEPTNSSGDHKDIKKLLQENQELLQKIHLSTEKARKYILFGRIMTLIYLILIVAPIIFAFIYLPPLLKGIAGPYQDLLGASPVLNSGEAAAGQLDEGFLQRLLEEAKKAQ